MKKILFATTALIATGGMAAADVSFGGLGRFGVVYDEGAATDTVLDHRFRLTITGTTETDNGVKFEGRVRFEDNDAADSAGSADGGGFGAAGFAVSTGGFRVDVGNVSDTFDGGDHIKWGGGDVGYTGFLSASHNFNNFNKNGFGAGANDGAVIKALYSGGDWNVSASVGFDDASAGGTDGEYWQIGGSYTFNGIRVGAMYGDNGSAGGQWAVGLDGSAGDFSYNIFAADNDVNADVSIGAGLSYSVSAAGTISGFVSSGGAAGNDTSYGIGYAHSLGGGVSLGVGVGQNSSGNTMADLGVSFNF